MPAVSVERVSVAAFIVASAFDVLAPAHARGEVTVDAKSFGQGFECVSLRYTGDDGEPSAAVEIFFGPDGCHATIGIHEGSRYDRNYFCVRAHERHYSPVPLDEVRQFVDGLLSQSVFPNAEQMAKDALFARLMADESNHAKAYEAYAETHGGRPDSIEVVERYCLGLVESEARYGGQA